MVKIITHTCGNCGTVVAGNVLEERREMKCPGLTCEEVLTFSDLDREEQDHILEHREQYTMED